MTRWTAEGARQALQAAGWVYDPYRAAHVHERPRWAAQHDLPVTIPDRDLIDSPAKVGELALDAISARR